MQWRAFNDLKKMGALNPKTKSRKDQNNEEEKCVIPEQTLNWVSEQHLFGKLEVDNLFTAGKLVKWASDALSEFKSEFFCPIYPHLSSYPEIPIYVYLHISSTHIFRGGPKGRLWRKS